jgi:hypothetical protein
MIAFFKQFQKSSPAASCPDISFSVCSDLYLSDYLKLKELIEKESPSL